MSTTVETFADSDGLVAAAGGDSSARREQAENRSGRRRFSGAGFTHNGNGLTAAHGQLDVMHGGRIVAESHFQARDAQQRQLGARPAALLRIAALCIVADADHDRHARDVESRASRNTSPIIKNASTASARAPAG